MGSSNASSIWTAIASSLATIATQITAYAASVVLWIRAGAETALANAADLVRVGAGVATSKLHVFGSVAFGIRAVAAFPDNLGVNDHEVLCTTGAVVGCVEQLPDCTLCPGREYIIKKIDAGVGTVVPTLFGAQGSDIPLVALTTQGDYVRLISNGVAGWNRGDARIAGVPA